MGDILFLYKHRMGEAEMLELKRLFESEKDETVQLLLNYKKDTAGVFFIKKISLEALK